jgi:phosphinothricin acetyltransferase
MNPRRATTADAPAICEIWNQAIRDTVVTFTTVEKTPTEIETRIAEAGAGFQVIDGPQGVVGFANFGAFRAGPGYSHVVEHSIYIDAEQRGQGQGALLMQALYAAARAQGKAIMIGCLTASNVAAEDFHTKQGFEKVGLLPNLGRKFAQSHDLLIMQKNL